MVEKYDFEHGDCEGDCGRGCRADMAVSSDGEFVLATDYATLESERDEWKRRCEAAEEDAQSWHDALDMLAAGMGEAIAASIAEGRDNE